MSDSDGELDLLNLSQRVRIMGEHETKTSPLVTRDAVLLSDQFAQRGVLGTVLSVHSDGMPGNTIDPRIYLNLNAPSSGLVCGVQGSGKSHTVSCILESSLMSSRRIGTLPAPLGTVVFHFDEENGERPCEASYLSELQDGSDRGVNEVVVLVSPSNLKTRRRVYSSLNFVQVEPLRIAEQDLNAARMLSMMGADNLETMPLYMHTILSILREMGSDEFNYRDFRKRLKDPEFNKAQSAMLDLRLDLLDSFLQGSGPDVKSFFKSGRLVIIDISDPFVESTTAAMLFDICLGLFIEWKSSTGKLIVLDEAHKYLTNSDANRFTKSICSIIRQQRHLAARVIVSTQETTVVPASVLDLLSWIICHRFSSPGWVKHLKNHICVEEEGDEGNDSKTVEWGKRVMTLHTGEALLYSPASLFATGKGKTAPLGTGYAIIMTRPRLTRDGGTSLLAIGSTSETATQVRGGLLTPRFSETSPSPVLTSTVPTLHVFNNSETPLSQIIDLVAASSTSQSITSITTGRQNASLALPLPPNALSTTAITGNYSFEPNAGAQTSAQSVPVRPMASFEESSWSDAPMLYDSLIGVMNALRSQGVSCPSFSTMGAELRRNNILPATVRLKAYLEAAEAAGIVKILGSGDTASVQLKDEHVLSDGSDSDNGDDSESPSDTSSESIPPIFEALLSVIEELQDSPQSYVMFSAVGVALSQRGDGNYRSAGYKKFRDLANAAEAEGLVEMSHQYSAGYERIRSLRG